MDCLINTSPLLLADALSWWINPANWWAIFQVVLALGLVIFVHELGHFVVAKLCGVKCEKFYVGFDFFDIKIGNTVIIPRSLAKFQWGETEYGIGIIPLGGYVKMLGQDDNPANQQREIERSKISKSELTKRDDDSGAASSSSPDFSNQPQGSSDGSSSEEDMVLDPRSYQAKSVPQRMAIISAGVIMNLIFAVIFAAIAYRMGVQYTPCEIGAVVPGDPAWRAGISAGDKILQLGRKGEPDNNLRFRRDLSSAVVLGGAGVDLDVLVRHLDGSEGWYTLQPTPEREDMPRPTIGILSRNTNVVRSMLPLIEHFPAGKTKPKFEPKDKVVGLQVEGEEKVHTIKTDLDYEGVLAAYPDKTITYMIQRPLKDAKKGETDFEEVRITVAPNRYKRWGLVMESGPISGVRPGSPAEKSQLQVGDRIEKIIVPQQDKEPLEHLVTDPVELPQLLMPYYGKQIELVVTRSEGKPSRRTVKITPQAPDTVESPIHRPHYDAPFSCAALGVVYPLLSKVRAVLPDSPAEKAGLRAGDEITEVTFVRLEEQEEDVYVNNRPMPIDSEKNRSWPLVLNLLQVAEPGREAQIKFKRSTSSVNGEEETVKLTETVDSGYWACRGLFFEGKTEIRTAENWGQAWSLGLRETAESAQMVLVFLKKLVTGQMSPMHLGGPGTIAIVATSEATVSLPRLLIFLTLFSANLAVVNFLPIPVLDGGHMMFLIAEGVRGKPLNEKAMNVLTFAGLFFILSLMLFVIGLDVFRIVQIL